MSEKKFPDLTGDGKVTQADVLKGRGVFNEGGSMMMPPEGMPVDTYPIFLLMKWMKQWLRNFLMKKWKRIILSM